MSDNNNNNNNFDINSESHVSLYKKDNSRVLINCDVFKKTSDLMQCSGLINVYGQIGGEVITTDIHGTVLTSLLLERLMIFFGKSASFSVESDKLSFFVYYKDKEINVSWKTIKWEITNGITTESVLYIPNNFLFINEIMGCIINNISE
jgi:hypothetical protein